MVARTVVVFALLALAACTPSSPPDRMVIHDETGAAFYVSRTFVDEIPDVTPPPLTCADGSEGSYAAAWGQYFYISSACPGQHGHRNGTERCVACLTDSDCPESDRMFECSEGLCKHRRARGSHGEDNVCGNKAPRWSSGTTAKQTG